MRQGQFIAFALALLAPPAVAQVLHTPAKVAQVVAALTDSASSPPLTGGGQPR